MAEIKREVLISAAAGLLMLQAGNAHAQGASQQGDAAQDASQAVAPGDIVVTARRREESLQTVPVSVQAFSDETLVSRGIVNSDDLQKLVPGVIFQGSGGSITQQYFIRGQGRDPIGPALPSVVNYFNDVPLTNNGSLLPTYDVTNLQVLKGPQGTLFGRNTTGGAVLASSALPAYDIEGYAQALHGSYDWVDLQGALNLPLVDDVLAVRIAGQSTRRDGYTKEQYSRRDRDARHEDSARFSVLFEPTVNIRNVSVADYFRTKTSGPALVPTGNYLTNFLIYRNGFAQLAFGPVLGSIVAAGLDCTTSIDCSVDAQVARQAAAGVRRSWTGFDTLAKQVVWGVSNTTTIDLGELTLKNIFGYRHQEYTQNQDADGIPLTIIDTYQRQSLRQITNEIQLSGSLFSDKLSWLLGAFYLNSTPDGPNVGAYDSFRPMNIPADQWPLSVVQNAFYKDESKAVFANLGYDLSGAVDGLRLSASARYTKDKEASCSLTTGPFSTPPIEDWKACLRTPGATSSRANFSKVTWQAGVDYKASSDLFLYADVRTGYRAGQLNTPALGAVLAPYQSFDPQTVMNYEVGLKSSWRAGSVSGHFNVSLFHSKSKALQRQVAGIQPNIDGDNNPLNDPNFTTLVINGGTAVYKGVEIDGSINPLDGLTLNFAGSYLDAKITELSTPPILAGQGGTTPAVDYAPEWSFAVGGEYRLPIPMASAGIYFVGNYYWAGKYFAVLQSYPSHDVLDLSLQWRKVGGMPLTTTVFVNNVTKSRYRTYQALNGNSPGFETSAFSAPRMGGVRLRYDF